MNAGDNEDKKDWRKRLQRTEGGRIKATNSNVIQILENMAEDPPFVSFDQFYSREFLCSTPPWSNEIFAEPRAIKDSDVISAMKM